MRLGRSCTRAGIAVRRVFTYLKPHIPKSIFLAVDSANVVLDFSIGSNFEYCSKCKERHIEVRRVNE